MKFTLSWLKEHLDTEADATAIADALTRIGLEVEAVEDKGAGLRDFIVAHVVSADKHPNADKLKLCMVDTGDDIVQVVCGAPNARTGMKAVFARPGVVIPASREALKISGIRGVESRGMLCSERELLLSDAHEGIIELPQDAVTGTSAVEALHLNDPVIEISLTPNRGDCASVYGIARDLAAAGLGTLIETGVAAVPGHFDSPKRVHLELPRDAENACPLFVGRLIRGVKNGPSPLWMQERLRAIGLRPISALVDITNLLTFDRGRPLHVFDADKLDGDLIVRLGREGESLIALDGRTYTLDDDMCVIADAKGAQSLGGIMGGEATGCTGETVNVFVEAALFDPVRTAATGRKLGILSDARYRFERGVDPEFVVPGMELATALILELCGGEPSNVTVAGRVPSWRRELPFSAARLARLVGLDIAEDVIVRILTNLGFAVEGSEALTVTPPSWRSDVHGPADLVEEVVRIYGLDKIPALPMGRPRAVAKPVLTPEQRKRRIVRRMLAARGFHETVNYSFISRASARLFGGGDETRQLENPIASDLDALRPSVLPSLLAAAGRNLAHGASDFQLAELGPQFESGLPEAQATVASGIRVGAGIRSWTKASHAPDLFDVKADILALVEAALGGPMTAPVRAGAPAWYHPGRSGTLSLGQKVLAYFGELHPAILEAFDIKVPVAGFEVFVDAVPEPKQKGKARGAFAPSPYPAVERDFAFVLDARISADDVIKAARGVDRQLIERVDVFDVYEGKGIADGKKSLAIAVRLQPRDKTLTEPEIDALSQKLVAAVTKATGGLLRS